MKISGIYKITNTITGDFYIGSSNDVKRRWKEHKKPSRWNDNPNNPMYLDMSKYGKDKFVFEVLEVVEPGKLKDAEQKFIETLNQTYNNRNANGLDIERYKETKKEYNKSDKGKETHRKSQNKYDNQLCFYNSETLTLAALAARFRKAGIPHPQIEAKKYLLNKSKDKEYQKEYQQSDEYKKYKKEYNNQLCSYNGEVLTLNALSKRFRRAGIPHSTAEAKKYLLFQ